MEMSYSQANTYLRCRRQWAFSKVDKLRGLPSIPSVRGNRYHSAIEKHVNEETGSSNRIVTNALDIVADFYAPESEVYLEKTVDSIKVRGYADIVACSEPDTEDKSSERVVIDWKFPGKHPGKAPKKEYMDQLQLYGLLAKAENLMVAFPEHDTAFSFKANKEHGQKVFDRLINVAKDIIDTDALNTPGMETEPQPNYLCASYCNHRAVCPLGGNNE